MFNYWPNSSMTSAAGAWLRSFGQLLRSEAPLLLNALLPRHYAIGFGLTKVKAGGVAVIKAQPQVEFYPERLVVPTFIAHDFLIIDIKVGPNSQFISAASMPASAFTETSQIARLNMERCAVAEELTISIQNLSTTVRQFCCVISGPGK